ncbi:hypothetical protein PsorP6_018514 [Peronosclerospora sorghi]|nr:hypothetical protein PsorP6_018514 [Peronosclerospora sorghi]
MYDACFKQFTEWSEDSRQQLAKEVAASNATWKLVKSHYSPYTHYDEAGMKSGLTSCKTLASRSGSMATRTGKPRLLVHASDAPCDQWRGWRDPKGTGEWDNRFCQGIDRDGVGLRWARVWLHVGRGV